MILEEKERLLREAEERRQRELRQRAAFDEACAKIESHISDEIVAKSASVSEEYDYQLRGIQREIDEANAENDRKRQGLEQQISEWNRQKSALGFFKGKEKKALQAQIDDAQSKINAIPSKQQVQSSFQAKINQINGAKQAAIDKVTAEVRSQYTMPKLEDFAEV